MKWLVLFLPLLALTLAAETTQQETQQETVIPVGTEKFQAETTHIQWSNFELEGEEPLEKTADIMSTLGAYATEVQEEAAEGAENVQRYSHGRGGNGGGWFTQDCHGSRRGTLRYVQMMCGHYVGRVRMHCMGGAFGYSGAGRGHGHGSWRNYHGPITKMLVGAGSYVDRVTFYGNRGRHLGYCGRSGGGGKYWCSAPSSEWSLCAIRGKAGWWMDKWQCGWCVGPGRDMRSINWWGSFDRRQWSRCPHGTAMHGMWRNTCHQLYCIEEVSCGGSGFTHCAKANWWGSLDRKGWSMCHGHYFISGYWRNGCHNLHCLEEAWCCHKPGHHWAGVGDANWWGSFDHIGYSLVPQGRFMIGIWRNTCDWIYCIELAKYAYPRAAAVNCVMHGWGGWGGCNRSCGNGIQYRYRGVRVHPRNGGRGCPTNRNSRRCNTHHCPIHCAVSGFGGWGGCNRSCGRGIQYRYRRITRHPKYGGRGCPGLRLQQYCNTHPCPVHCAVSGFSGWGGCSQKCGVGAQVRTRRITRSPRNGGRKCPHLRESRRCQIKPCPIHCRVSGWTGFSRCSKSCGKGTQYRTRKITKQDKHGGNKCPPLKETRGCQIKPCPIHCKQTAWSKWGGCSKKCGGGTQKRTRKTTQEAKFGGKRCGNTQQNRNCATKPCPIHCEVGPWQAPSTCSKKCGGGKRSQSRRISTKPKYGGRKCPATSRTLSCNTQPCPINGGWGKWGKWSPCSRICQGGQERRARQCNKPAPKYGGKSCSGPNYQNNACNTMHCSSITNCGDVKLIYAKTMSQLVGSIGQCNKNIASFDAQLKYAIDEVKDSEKLAHFVGGLCYKSRGSFNYPKNDRRNFSKVGTLGRCKELCSLDSGCKGAVYNRVAKRCWLKNKLGNKKASKVDTAFAKACGSGEGKMLSLILKGLAEARKALAKLQAKKSSETKELGKHTNRKNKLGHSKKKCDCDARRKQVVPLVDRAEQKMKDNSKAIAAYLKAKATIDGQIAGFNAQIANFSWLPPSLKKLMAGMFIDLKKRATVESVRLAGMIAKMQGHNKMWLGKIGAYKTELSKCDKAVQQLGKSIKKLLEEIDMLHILDEVTFGDMHVSYREFFESDMADFHEETANAHYIFDFEETEAEQSTASAQSSWAEYGLSGLMVVGGVTAFFAGRRQQKYEEYTIVE